MRVEWKDHLSSQDEECWNRQLGVLPNAHPFQQLFARELWSPEHCRNVRYLLLWQDGADVVLHGAALVREHPSVGTWKRWTVFRGPLCRTPEDLSGALAALLEEAKKQSILSVTVSPYFENAEGGRAEALLQTLDCRRNTVQGGHTQSVQVDLTAGADDILRSFNENTRRQIRKAQDLAIEVGAPKNADETKAFVALYHQMSRERGADALQADYLERFAALAQAESAHGLFLLARFEGKVVAGILLLHNQHQSWYIHGASDFAVRQIPLTFLLHWEAMQQLKGRGIRLYNFGGLESVDDERKAIRGISQFKLGFSKTVVTCTAEFDRVLRPGLYAFDRRLRGLARWLRKPGP